MDLILDTDIGTDVDDALALAFAMRHPRLRLRAVTTVSGDTEARAAIAARLLRLGGAPDLEVGAGRPGPPIQYGRRVWMGHEGAGLPEDDAPPAHSLRDAASLIAQTCDGTVTVATIGMQANLEEAIVRDPTLPGRIPLLAVMGGVMGPGAADRPVTPADDHNLNADPPAALSTLCSGVPLLIVPCDVTFRTYLDESHLRRLRGGDPLCRALAALIDVWAPILSGFARVPGQVAALHDPLAVACLVDQSFVRVETLPVRVFLENGIVRTSIDPQGGKPAEVVRDVDPAGFAEFFMQTILGD